MDDKASVEELRIDVPGFTIAAKAWGARHGKPIICLHGMLDNAASFDFLAPLIPNTRLIAIDFPGNGYSSAYPAGVLPNWMNDAFLILKVVNALNLNHFDILAHSYGSLAATVMAISKKGLVGKMIFLDILGPKVNFLHNYIEYLRGNIESYFGNKDSAPAIFLDQEAAIKDRMKRGLMSYRSAQALVERGTKKTVDGVVWNHDRKLSLLSSTLPHEDELNALFQAIETPVCLMRAEQGVPYPEDIFLRRKAAIKGLITKTVPGGHHVHMDDPQRVVSIIEHFLLVN